MTVKKSCPDISDPKRLPLQFFKMIYTVNLRGKLTTKQDD